MIKGMADHPVIFACANPRSRNRLSAGDGNPPRLHHGYGPHRLPEPDQQPLRLPLHFPRALDVYATEINEAMKLAAARALAALAKEPVPAEVSAAYQGQTFSFGQGYVIPKPL